METQANATDKGSAAQALSGVRGRAVALAAFALLASLGVGYFSYQHSRRTLLDSLSRGHLRLARTLANEAGLALSDDQEKLQEALGDLARLWSATEKRFPGSYLCVVGSDGDLLLHTSNPSLVGRDVTGMSLERGTAGEQTSVGTLLAERKDWTGLNPTLDGEPVLSAFAFNPVLEGYVAVHVPLSEVEAEIQAAALPWAAGQALLVAALLGGALGLLHWSQRRSQTALRERVRQQAAVAELGRRALELGDSRMLMQEAAGAVTRVLGIEHASVFVVEPDGRHLRLVAGVGWPEDWVDAKMIEANEKTPAGYSLLSGEPLVVEELTSDPRFREAGRLHELGVRSTICAVIPGRQRARGVVTAHSQRPRRVSTDDLSFLQAVANVLAAAKEHGRTNEALQESERALSTLMSNLPGMAYRCRNDPDWTMEFMSEGCLELTGYLPSELLENRETSYSSLIHPDDRQPVWETVQERVAEKQPFEVMYRIRTADGLEKWVWEKGRAIYGRRGEVLALEGFVTDVSDRRALEEQLRQAQKMEAIGQLAGGVAHDFNNLLMVIAGHAELLADRIGPDEPLRRHVEQIRQTAERATALTRQLLAFSRKQVMRPQVFDVNEVVGGMEDMLRRLIGEDIELSVTLAPKVGRVRADPAQLEQVILNLAVNARDAMPRGGRLTVETANVELDPHYAREHVSAQPGPHVMLAVSDTGMGMDEATQARIFEPFFTTKEKGKGTGLGLSTVYGIVKQSGGWIWVYSEVGQGTTFKIYLPRMEPAEEREVAPAPAPAAASQSAPRVQAPAGSPGSRCVLLVEDQEALRSLVRSYLERMGHPVLEAASGEEALRQAEKHTGGISLLISDVVMPAMSGRQLAEQLQELRPEMKVLFVSGYTDDAVVRHGVLQAGAAFLQKPFSYEALQEKVRALLS